MGLKKFLFQLFYYPYDKKFWRNKQQLLPIKIFVYKYNKESI